MLVSVVADCSQHNISDEISRRWLDYSGPMLLIPRQMH